MSEGTEEPFPPLSTSLESFLEEGSDAKFRKLISGLLKMSSAMLATRERYAAAIDVSPPQYSILMLVAEAGATTVGRIAAELEVASPFVTLQVNQLMKIGLLSKSPNPEDKRSSLVALTEEGKRRILKVAPIRKASNDLIFGEFSHEEAQELTKTIDRLRRSIASALHKLHDPHR